MQSSARVVGFGFDGANLLFWLAVHLACSALVAAVARRRGLPLVTWVPLGLFFGVLALAGVLLARPPGKESTR